MDRISCVAYFFGGIFLANATPYLVSGVLGRAFQSPFAKPMGVGLSSSTVNVLWGAFNLIISYLLIWHVGDFEVRAFGDVLPLGLGALVFALYMARSFGRFHGGNSPISNQ